MKDTAPFHRQPVVLAILCAALAGGATSARASEPSPPDQALAARAIAAFGKQDGQRFNAGAVALASSPSRTDTMTVTLAPGKGAEVKAVMAAGQSFVFHWTASAAVAVDMHGDHPDAKDEYTSYSVEGGQREAAGTFTAPFAGAHGWYWKNSGKQPVTVQVSVTGFQTRLVRQGQP